MLLILLLLFIFVPLVELALLLYLADTTSWQLTLGLVVATGVFGTALARSQGWRAWSRIRDELAAGRMPAEPLLDAVLIFVAGALLLTPGILTDLLRNFAADSVDPQLLPASPDRVVEIAIHHPHFGLQLLAPSARPLRGHRLVRDRPGSQGRHEPRLTVGGPVLFPLIFHLIFHLILHLIFIRIKRTRRWARRWMEKIMGFVKDVTVKRLGERLGERLR